MYIRKNEIWLMERILRYAKEQGYTEYTSTLLEAWRVSIVGMSDAIIESLKILDNELPQFSPHDQFSVNPVAKFGVTEARLHRERGISLQMFLGLYKYYRYTFVDLIADMDVSDKDKRYYEQFVVRIFDIIEIAFCSEWSGISSDNAILELQKSNREITNEKNKYLTSFESLSIPAFLIDDCGLIENLNHAALLMLGIDLNSGASYYVDEKLKEVVPTGKSISEVLCWISEEVNDFLAGKFSTEKFEINHKADGQNIYYTVRFARMKDVSEKFKGGIVSIEDITATKLLEIQLSQAQKLESLGQLAAGIAHEINTPLQFIGHNIQFIGESLDDLLPSFKEGISKSYDEDSTELDEIEYLKNEIPTAIQESLDGVNRVSTIVQALKKFAHPDQQSFTKININDVVENVIEVTRNEWKYVADIKTELSDNLFLIAGVRGEMNQIFLNLIVNAIHAVREKYGKESNLGEIVVHTRNHADFVVMSIKDNGCGVPDNIIHRIFDPFFTTKEVGEGTGQGLYIVHTLVEKINGKVNFNSEEGVGTEFIIHLPKAF